MSTFRRPLHGASQDTQTDPFPGSPLAPLYRASLPIAVRFQLDAPPKSSLGPPWLPRASGMSPLRKGSSYASSLPPHALWPHLRTTLYVAVRVRAVALPRGTMPRLLTLARPRRLRPSRTGAPSRYISRERPMPRFPSTCTRTPPSAVLPTSASVECYPGRAHATPPLHPHSHIAPSVLRAHPFWCTSPRDISP